MEQNINSALGEGEREQTDIHKTVVDAVEKKEAGSGARNYGGFKKKKKKHG